MRACSTWFILCFLCFLFYKYVYDTYWLETTLRPKLGSELELLADTILMEDIKFPEVYLAQVIHETNWLKSDVYKDHNNPSGMHCHSWGDKCKCNDTNRHEKDGTFCDYPKVSTGIADYGEWQDYRLGNYNRLSSKRLNNSEDYLNFLDNFPIGDKWGFRYASDRKYTKKVRKYLPTAVDIINSRKGISQDPVPILPEILDSMLKGFPKTLFR